MAKGYGGAVSVPKGNIGVRPAAGQPKIVLLELIASSIQNPLLKCSSPDLIGHSVEYLVRTRNWIHTMKNRLRKRWLYAEVQAFKQVHHWMTDEECIWEFMRPVGREFGSQDYERLMGLDAIKEKAIAAVKSDKSRPI
jgi:hypothetical protein